MQKFKRLISFIIALLITALTYIPALAEEELKVPDTSMAKASCVYNIENKEICYISGEEEILYPASVAKMMTAILALDHYSGALDTKITVTEESLLDSGSAGLSINLQVGEIVTAQDLIYALIVGGAGDAAYVLAHEISGGTNAFVQSMNARAEELGMSKTFFSNPTGEHTDRMVTSIGDVILLATEAYNTNGFTDFAGTAAYDMPATELYRQRAIRNRNSFISAYYDNRYRDPSVFGLNAGFTEKAGSCVIAVENDGEGKTFITAVMGAASNDKENFGYKIAADLMSWANKAFSFTCVLEATRIITEFPVIMSDKKDTVPLLPEKKIDALLPSDVNVADEVSVEYTLTEKNFSAPVSPGMVAGTVSAYYQGELLGTVNLVAKSNVSRSNIKYVFRKFLELFTKPLFYLVIVILVAVYYLYKSVIGKKRAAENAKAKKRQLQREYEEDIRKRSRKK